MNYSRLTNAVTPEKKLGSGVPELILVVCLIVLAGLMLL